MWRESLLAQKVLEGGGQKAIDVIHSCKDLGITYPQQAIAYYLMGVWEEGHRRGYHFNKAKIGAGGSLTIQKIPITKGQLRYELQWLCTKVQRRDYPTYQRLLTVTVVECHPSFKAIEGAIEEWEQVTSS